MRFQLISMFLLGALLAPAQIEFPPKKKEKDDPTIRIVQGAVRNTSDEFVPGAVVQIKNMKTLQIRSFITKEDGKYVFNNLGRDVDYEVRAEGKGFVSAPKTVSTFDNRKIAVVNLKLDTAKPDNTVEKK